MAWLIQVGTARRVWSRAGGKAGSKARVCATSRGGRASFHGRRHQGVGLAFLHHLDFDATRTGQVAQLRHAGVLHQALRWQAVGQRPAERGGPAGNSAE